MSRWLRRTVLAVTGIAAALVLAVVGAATYASHVVAKRWDVPAPPIGRATDAALVARGERLFRSACFECHADRDGIVSGRRMADVPAFLGTFHSSNLTAHPEAGVGGWSDAELARAIRFGIRPDGRGILVMSAYAGISDEDLSAIIGYMRSGDPMFTPVAATRPAPEVTLVGKLILAAVVGFDPAAKAAHVTAPPPGPSAEYGRYLAEHVVDCWGCHTAGFSPSKLHGEDAYAGGFELLTPDGRSILTSNITPDEETGIGRWSRDEFVRAVREGVRPDGRPVRLPMPRYAALSDDELTAIWAHLRTIRPVRAAVPRAR